MVRYAQFVIGPGGCGKSTYCSSLQNYTNSINRTIHIINLDPDAEYFDYQSIGDIRDLISISDLKEGDVKLGPNGGLVYCLEYLARNLEWLDDIIGEFDDDYFVFDCPGQIELYQHLDVMQRILEYLKQKHHFNICTVYILDCHFLTDFKNYLTSSVVAMSATLNLACAHLNIMMKIDMLSPANKKKMLKIAKKDFKEIYYYSNMKKSKKCQKFLKRMAEVLDDGMVGGFLPINITEENSIMAALYTIDLSLGYGEDLDIKQKEFDDIDDNNE